MVGKRQGIREVLQFLCVIWEGFLVLGNRNYYRITGDGYCQSGVISGSCKS